MAFAAYKEQQADNLDNIPRIVMKNQTDETKNQTDEDADE